MTRTALVTGGASGIGRACAQRFADDGMNVVIVDLDPARGEAAAAALGAHFVETDLTQRSGCRRAVDAAVETFGGLDVLVCNAGFQHIDPIPDFPEDTWDSMLALMLTSPFLLTKYAWPHLIASGHGRVIHMGSAHSLTASPFKAGYVTAKHGLLGLTRTTALEGGEHGVTCNLVCPSYVRTPLVEAQIEDQARTRGIGVDEVEAKVFLENTAIKRMLEPEDVADYVAYLASESAWGITGSAQTIDQGWSAR